MTASAGQAHSGPILVGVDGSPSSLKALAWAIDYAELTRSSVLAVSTWSLPSSYGWAVPLPEGIDFEGETRATLESATAEAAKQHPGVEVDIVVSEGAPAAVLTELSRQASLLVVGSRGHGELAGMLIGSVSLHVVSHARCPVLVIR